MIKMESVTVTFKDESRGLDDVSLVIPKGQCVALTGKSGCGKSTLLSCINGVGLMEEDWQVSGSIHVFNRQVTLANQEGLVSVVGSVFQNPRTQFFTTTVIDELTFVCENLGMSRLAISDALDQVISLFDLTDLVHSSMFELSSGQQQLVGLAAAYIQKPEVLVLDEPTSNLDFQMTRKMTAILDKLKSQGVTIVIADHRLLYLADLADRMIVLSSGKIIYDESVSDFKSLPLDVRRQYGLRVFFERELPTAQLLSGEAKGEAPDYLEGENLRVQFNKKELALNVDQIQLNKGELLSIVGHNGAGKTTLLKVLSGLQKLSSGTIFMDGKKQSLRALRKNAYLVLQDVVLQLLGETVWKELSLFTKDEAAIEEAARQFSLETLLNKHPFSLSGGEQQRLALAGAFLADKDLIILDEPTSGLDWYHMQDVINGIKKLQNKGKTVIVVSHDWEFLCTLGGHLLHLKNGKIVSEMIDHSH